MSSWIRLYFFQFGLGGSGHDGSWLTVVLRTLIQSFILAPSFIIDISASYLTLLQPLTGMVVLHFEATLSLNPFV